MFTNLIRYIFPQNFFFTFFFFDTCTFHTRLRNKQIELQTNPWTWPRNRERWTIINNKNNFNDTESRNVIASSNYRLYDNCAFFEKGNGQFAPVTRAIIESKGTRDTVKMFYIVVASSVVASHRLFSNCKMNHELVIRVNNIRNLARWASNFIWGLREQNWNLIILTNNVNFHFYLYLQN